MTDLLWWVLQPSSLLLVLLLFGWLAALFGRTGLARRSIALTLLAVVGVRLALGGFFWLGLFAMAATFVHQQALIRQRERSRCFQAFLNNHWSGLLVFAGIALSLWPSAG